MIGLLALSISCESAAMLAAATKVGVYGSTATGFVGRLAGLGYETTQWTTASQVSAAALSTIDVLYVHTGRAGELSTNGSTIAEWTAQGHGLIVEQPNAAGFVTMMPSGLSIKILSNDYDGSHNGPDPLRDVALTSAGAAHAITSGLTHQDICENADRVLTSDISPAWSVLAVQASNPNYVALASAGYGAGRVFFHTGNTNPTAFTPGSDLYVHRMIDWAAVPEPSAIFLAIVGSSVPSARRRKSVPHNRG
jgi:hypothetical protein